MPPSQSAGIRPGWISAIVVCGALVATALLYARGLPGGWIFDDIANIRDNPRIEIEQVGPAELAQAANSSPVGGPYTRAIAFASFALNHAWLGGEPIHFKLVNIAIHLVNGLLVFWMLHLAAGLYLQRRNIAMDPVRLELAIGAIAAIWLVAPINLTSVLYAVQRMTSLSALFTLAAIIVYLNLRRRQFAGHRPRWLRVLPSMAAWLALGYYSKENAALLPLLLLVIEWILLGFHTAERRERRRLIGFFVVALAVPMVTALAWFLADPSTLLRQFNGRGFTLIERLLTEARALWMYVGMIVVPQPDTFTLFHDDFGVSRGLRDPWTTLPALTALALAVAGVFALRRRAPMLAFGIAWFLAGHAMESTVLPLELVHEHRNYLPGIGVIALLVWPLLTQARAGIPALVARWLVFGWFVGSVFVTAVRADDWAIPERLFVSQALAHPDSPRSNFQAATLLTAAVKPGTSPTDDAFVQPARLFARMIETDPNNADGMIGLIILHLHAAQPLPHELFNATVKRLREMVYTPESLTISQFSFLVEWQGSPQTAHLPDATIVALFDAALDNRGMRGVARAALLSSKRAYYQHVIGDLDAAQALADEAYGMVPRSDILAGRVIEVALARNDLKRAREVLNRYELEQPGIERRLGRERLREMITEFEHGTGRIQRL
ncbi:MAG: hypothetical protein KDG50_05655 [Chromatiales bacterium]|nr:hypothetical protein [Chromatiales bacterium]